MIKVFPSSEAHAMPTVSRFSASDSINRPLDIALSSNTTPTHLIFPRAALFSLGTTSRRGYYLTQIRFAKHVIVRDTNEVKLSELLFEPTPLAHIWTTIVLLCTFHIITLRSSGDLGASLFTGVAIGYFLLSLPPLQFIFGWKRPSRVSIPIFLFCSALFSASIHVLGNNLPDGVPGISASLSLIFPIVALGRGFFLLGGFMGKAITSKPNIFMKVVSANIWFLLVLRIILLSFLIWWFGFGARNCQLGAWNCVLGVWTCLLGAWICLLGPAGQA